VTDGAEGARTPSLLAEPLFASASGEGGALFGFDCRQTIACNNDVGLDINTPSTPIPVGDATRRAARLLDDPDLNSFSARMRASDQVWREHVGYLGMIAKMLRRFEHERGSCDRGCRASR